jgi:hypothetical protein
LAKALDSLTASHLDDAQTAQLKQFRDTLPATVTDRLKAYREHQSDVVKLPYVGLGVV